MVALVGQAGRVACLSVCWTWVGHTQSPVDVVCQAISCQIWCQTCNIQHPEVEVRHNAAARPAERAAPAKRLCRCARVKGGNKLECRAGVSVGAPRQECIMDICCHSRTRVTHVWRCCTGARKTHPCVSDQPVGGGARQTTQQTSTGGWNMPQRIRTSLNQDRHTHASLFVTHLLDMHHTCCSQRSAGHLAHLPLAVPCGR